MGAMVVAVTVWLVLMLKSWVMVEQGTSVVLQRFGRYHSTLAPGFHFLIPFVDAVKTVTWSSFEEVRDSNGRSQIQKVTRTMSAIPECEQMLDLDPVNVLSSDQLEITVNCVMWYKVLDVKTVVYGVCDLTRSLQEIIKTRIRDFAARTMLNEAINGKESMEREVKTKINEEVKVWGVEVPRLEIQSVDAGKEIRKANTQLVVNRKLAETRQLQYDTDRKAKIAEQEMAMAVEKLEREREIAKRHAELELEKQRHDAEMHILQKKAEADAHAKMVATKAEREAAKILLQLKQEQNEVEYQNRLKLAQADAAGVEAQVKAGMSPEFFVQREYTRNVGMMLQNASKVIVPANMTNFLGVPGLLGALKDTFVSGSHSE